MNIRYDKIKGKGAAAWVGMAVAWKWASFHQEKLGNKGTADFYRWMMRDAALWSRKMGKYENLP